MSVDVLILNTGVADFRHEAFDFADALAGQGGLALCEPCDMPQYSQDQFRAWIEEGRVTAGGPGNSAPLMAGAGLKVAVGVNLGKGSYGGLDAQGRFFHDTMTAHGIDMSATHVHPGLPTGTTFIHKVPAGERGGIAYFPNANHDFDFERFKAHVARLEPRIVYYMYSGLSRRGDAKDGRDLADFMRWCRKRGALTIADCHTLTGSPDAVIRSGRPVNAYKLLVPLLPEVDIFFTSSDEARMIGNTLTAGSGEGAAGVQRMGSPHRVAIGRDGPPGRPRTPRRGVPTDRTCFTENSLAIPDLLQALYAAYRGGESRTRVFGITVQDGAYEIHARPDGAVVGPAKVASRFMDGGVIDLVGAGDAFRAGLLAYIARNLEGFRHGSIDFAEAVQMGNLFAARFIKAPLGNRYAMKPYETMLKALSGPVV